MSQQKKTTLDSDVTKPSVTQPGDGPADTVDPTERASSTPVRPGPEARAVGTVNAAVPLEQPKPATRDSKKDRTETYEATAPDGSTVKVTRNLETGESKVS